MSTAMLTLSEESDFVVIFLVEHWVCDWLSSGLHGREGGVSRHLREEL